MINNARILFAQYPKSQVYNNKIAGRYVTSTGKAYLLNYQANTPSTITTWSDPKLQATLLLYIALITLYRIIHCKHARVQN
jgi:hypothetical protein